MMLARLARVQRGATAAARIPATRIALAGSRAALSSAQALFSSSTQSVGTATRELRNTNEPRLGHSARMSVPLLMVTRARVAGYPLVVSGALLHTRHLSNRRNPWQQNSDWVTTAKTGALVMLGAGALIASTSLAFGVIIMGAAGYGVYSLYQKVFGPYRSHHGSSDPFAGVNADIDRLNEMFGRKSPSSQRSTRSASHSHSHNKADAMGSRELDALVQELPLVVRGFVKTIFSFVSSAMKSSMQRAGELRRITNEHVQSHPRIVSQFGSAVSVSTPQQWMESTVNGVGWIDAVFPVSGTVRAQVTAKASVDQSGGVNLRELKFHNRETGEVVDLLRDGGAGPRKTVVDAEYVDL